MNFKIYNNGTILAPVKCGSRFLDEVFEDTFIGFSIDDVKRTLFLPKLKSIIVRHPMEHFKSALHTAVLTEWNFGERNEDEPFDMTPIIKEFCYWNRGEPQNTHWRHDTYEVLYWSWRRNIKNDIEVVELKDLSSHLEKLNIKNLPKYDSKRYDFKESYKNWCTKDEIMLFVKENHSIIWNNYMKQIENSIMFYDYLMNKELIEIKLL